MTPLAFLLLVAAATAMPSPDGCPADAAAATSGTEGCPPNHAAGAAGLALLQTGTDRTVKRDSADAQALHEVIEDSFRELRSETEQCDAKIASLQAENARLQEELRRRDAILARLSDPSLVQALAKVTDPAMPDLGKLLLEPMKKIGTDALADLTKGLPIEDIKKLVETVKTLPGKIIEKLKNLPGDFQEKLKGTITTILTNIKDVIGKMIGDLANKALSGLTNTLTDAISKGLNGLFGGGAPAAAAPAASLSTVSAIQLHNATGTGSGLYDNAKARQRIRSSVKAALGKFSHSFKDIVVTGIETRCFDPTEEASNNTTNMSAVQGSSHQQKRTPDFGAMLLDPLKKLGEDLLGDTTKDVTGFIDQVKGLVEKMKDMPKVIQEKIKTLPDLLQSKLKDVLKVLKDTLPKALSALLTKALGGLTDKISGELEKGLGGLFGEGGGSTAAAAPAR